MRSAEQVVWDFVQEWLRRGEEDLVVAQELMGRDRTSYDPVGFHANQAAGDFLKALLIRYQVPFPKSDSVRVLLCLAESKEPDIQESLGVSCEAEIQRPKETRSLNREAATNPLNWQCTCMLSWARAWRITFMREDQRQICDN